MKILSFDTSSTQLSAALYEDSKKLAGYESEGPGRHSDILAPVLRKLLKRAKVPPKKIGCIAVGVGPGSFTGLRVAVTTAKILSYALKTKIIGVSSLEAAARSIGRDGKFAVLVDAKKSQVYAAVYQRKNGQWKTLQKLRLAGREVFLKSVKREVTVLDSARPAASGIAEAALERILQNKFDDCFLLEPLYLHPKDCNVAQSAKR